MFSDIKVMLVILAILNLSGWERAFADEVQMKESFTLATFGTSLTNRGGWPEALRERLSVCFGIPVQLSNISKGGATTEWGLQHTQEVTSANPDVIVIEFYANDAALNRFRMVSTSSTAFGKILDALLDGAPEARILMVVLNPIFGVKGWVRPFLEDFIDAHAREAQTRGLEIVDLRSSWTTMSSNELELAIPDGLHPRPETMARLIAPRLAEILASEGCPASGRDGPTD